MSPRLLVRAPAVAAWTEALRARGGDLLPADDSLLSGVRATNEAQQKLLLLEGLGADLLGHDDDHRRDRRARARAHRDRSSPSSATPWYEDVSTWAVGHLNHGLLEAHGLDEGGEPQRGIGGHDRMWFALRDLAFGDVRVPDAAGAAAHRSSRRSGDAGARDRQRASSAPSGS